MSTILRVRATLDYGSGGPGVHTSYWIPGTTGGVTADASDAVARVRAYFAAVQSMYPTSTTITVQTDVAQINDNTGALVGTLGAASVGTVIGTNGSTISPQATMVLLRLRTGLVVAGRLLRGRWFNGPVGTAAIAATGGTSAGAITAFNAGGNGLLAAGATTSRLAVWNRPTNVVGTSAEVTSVSTWEKLAVMRSRRDG